ncbi:hypothetical protein IMAU80009_02748 [Lactiplantibacillus plantarum]|nr:hypothetical protein [Lactiplantibacillus plantarum]
MSDVSEDELLSRMLISMSTRSIDGNDAQNFINTIHNGTFHVRHAKIAKVIYAVNDEGIDNLNKSCQTIETAPAYDKSTEKLISSIRLSMVQRDFILKNIKNAGIEAEKIKDTKSQIYTDIISVLGIFSALIFALFGGLSLLSSISNLVKGVRLSRIVLLTSGVSLALIVLIFLLLNGISGMVGKNMKVCCHKDNCVHTLFEKYPFFVIGVSFCFIMMVVSVIILLIDNSGALYDHPYKTVTMILIFTLIAAYLFYRLSHKHKEA